ncbi:MAG: hypothetical protein ACLP7Q_03305 [Isosphaeraceae bacterium]
MAIMLLLLMVAFIVTACRWENREAYRDEYREKARHRLLKKTGWQPLDAINAELYLAYSMRDLDP